MRAAFRRASAAAAILLCFCGGVSAIRAGTYTVTNTNPTGAGSLAQAILDSNSAAGQDTIAFNIPGSGVHLIDLSQSSLPEITDSVVLDGYTQPGAHPNTLRVGDDATILIQLDGGSVPKEGYGSIGLSISGTNCVIRGLSITAFSANSQSIGGLGIFLGRGSGNMIQGNFIGIKPDGFTPAGNTIGIDAGKGKVQSTIGGADPAARNVISGNRQVGIEVADVDQELAAPAIMGNYIGTDASGMRAVGNGLGVVIATSEAVVGGTSAGSGNLISGNGSGLQLGYEVAPHIEAPGDRALIQGNLIGTAADGNAPLGNGAAGVSFQRSSDSALGGLEPGAGNVIAFNGSGVGVYGDAAGDRILSNSIYANTSRGISVYHGQSAPVITTGRVSKGHAIITGTLQSAPDTQYLVQIFADSQSLTSSKQTYLGTVNVTTDGSGGGSFSANFPASDSNVVFNATATDPNGNTSEFFRNPANLQNLSARASVGTGDNALIGGLILQYGAVVVRGIGPSLRPLGLPNALGDPTLQFHDESGAKFFNDNWKDDQSQASSIQASGLAPTNDLESAIDPFGSPGLPFRSFGGFAPFTAIVRGKGDTTGIGVVEAYGLTDPNHGIYPKLGNISARAFVGTGDDVIIGGFIVGDGNEDTRIVIRAIGPSLASSGIAHPLQDPVLELHDGNGAVITTNDNWADTQGNDLQTVELAPKDVSESAILARLAAGAYTAIVRGKNNATGVALVEVYRLP